MSAVRIVRARHRGVIGWWRADGHSLVFVGERPPWDARAEEAPGRAGKEKPRRVDFDEVTPNGVTGNPKLSSAEAGRKLLDRVVKIGSKFVRQFAAMPTRIEGPPGPRVVRSA